MLSSRARWCLATAGVAALPSPGAAVEVDVRRHAFRPATIAVTAGEVVTWTFSDPDPHTVTGAPISPLEPLDSLALVSGGRFSRTFRVPGTYEYLCAVHPTMTGTVVVGGPPSAHPPSVPEAPVAPPADSLPPVVVPPTALAPPLAFLPTPVTAAVPAASVVSATSESVVGARPPESADGAAAKARARPQVGRLIGPVRLDGRVLRVRVRAALPVRAVVRSADGRVRRLILARGPGVRSIDLRRLPTGRLVISLSVLGARGAVRWAVEPAGGVPPPRALISFRGGRLLRRA